MPKISLPDPSSVLDPPDIFGFKDAMDRLRLATGTNVGFEIPNPPTWAAGTALARDGSPLDPTVVPISGGGFTETVKRVGVILKQESALRPGADTRFNEAGALSGIDAIFDLGIDDYPDVQAATEVWMEGLKFKIVEWKPFGVGNRMLRYSVYAEEK